MEKKNLLSVGIALICLIGVVLTIVIKNGSGKEGSEAVEDFQASTDSVIRESVIDPEFFVISLAEISEIASFYPVVIDGTEMEVLAVKASDGSIRTAFNTCQSCYASGNGRYEAEGAELVCQNCGFHFSADEVGIEAKGGCNPWPITDANREITDDEIIISSAFLAESKKIFANWSRR